MLLINYKVELKLKMLLMKILMLTMLSLRLKAQNYSKRQSKAILESNFVGVNRSFDLGYTN